MRTETRKKFRRKKKEAFREFASTIDFKHDLTYTWLKAKIFKNKWTKTKSDVCCGSTDKIRKINEALDKMCQTDTPSSSEEIPDSHDDDFFDNPFTYAE